MAVRTMEEFSTIFGGSSRAYRMDMQGRRCFSALYFDGLSGTSGGIPLWVQRAYLVLPPTPRCTGEALD